LQAGKLLSVRPAGRGESGQRARAAPEEHPGEGPQGRAGPGALVPRLGRAGGVRPPLRAEGAAWAPPAVSLFRLSVAAGVTTPAVVALLARVVCVLAAVVAAVLAVRRR